ncbi:MAG: hypothetical protein QG632_222 [Candidatus Dependentiae bacterium]|nr:hypothetical protein [Candidatus Dependentiae bacterium]
MFYDYTEDTSMSYAPIILSNITLAVPGKTLINSFNATIPYGSKIGIIGRNGSGKSTLLKLIEGVIPPASGTVTIPDESRLCAVPQLITNHHSLSGSQRFNATLSTALAMQPTILLLDEPTNHLDRHNRRSLLRMLQSFEGTLIVVSHDVELLRSCVTKLWHIEDGSVQVSAKTYDEYLKEMQQKKEHLLHTIAHLNRQKKEAHAALMKEQGRSKKQKAYGEKKYASAPPLLRKHQKESGENTSNKNRRAIGIEKQSTLDQLKELKTPEVIAPTFTLLPAAHAPTTLITITDGSVGYYPDAPVVQNVTLTITSDERVALLGANGSGKSTIVKGILESSGVHRTGTWHLPAHKDIGYLDQHYGTLNPEQSVLETVHTVMPSGTPHAEIRRHLNRYLFRTNQEVNATVATLSGGERARLSLALIGAHTPKLLILDEVTNNLDLETRQHVIEVLKEYPGALLVISHDYDFLVAIGITTSYEISGRIFTRPPHP